MNGTKLLFSFFLFVSFLLPISIAQTQELDFIQSRLFQLTSSVGFKDWLFNPLWVEERKKKKRKFLAMLAPSNGLLEAYKDFDSGDSDRIIDRVNKSFGKPFSAGIKLELSLKGDEFLNHLSSNIGSFFIVNDPTFSEVELLLFRDYVIKTSKSYQYFNNKLLFAPRITYGFRKVMKKKFTITELVKMYHDLEFSQKKYNPIVELNFLLKYKFENFSVHFDLKSFPLISKEKLKYWETNLGFKSRKFNLEKKGFYLNSLELFFSYSPFYGGLYDVSKTFKFGTNLELLKGVSLSLFSLGEFKPGLKLEWSGKSLSGSIYYYEYEYGSLKKRFIQNGVSVNFNF